MRISTLFLMAVVLFIGKLYEFTKFKVFENLALFFAKPLANRFVDYVNDKIEN